MNYLLNESREEPAKELDYRIIVMIRTENLENEDIAEQRLLIQTF